MKVVRHQNRLPREAVNACSLVVFKVRLDGALSNLVWWKGSRPMAGELELDGHFQPKPFYNKERHLLLAVVLCWIPPPSSACAAQVLETSVAVYRKT